MKYTDFEDIMSAERMGKYLDACNGDTNKAMTLYRNNLHLSQTSAIQIWHVMPKAA